MKSILFTYSIILMAHFAIGQVNNAGNLMPVPKSMERSDERLAINEMFRISVHGHPDTRLYAEASRMLRRISDRTGIFLDKQGFVQSSDTSSNAALLIVVERAGKLELHEDESYRLDINSRQAIIYAPTDIGALHGLETMMQLVSADANGYYFPGVKIKDEPRFAWRGLLLDVALHFMPMDVVKRTLDGMAAEKMNVLHLHLCNDQGFRVESKLFPRLNQVASEGKYFSQDDIREIVAYAGQRGIRIVPEFVVPAHTTAILTAFPELASVHREYTPERYFGVFDPVLDPTNEKVYEFLDKLFGEMMALFPDKYFHIGGDENTGKDWEHSPHIKAFMKANDMNTYMDLQTHFNKRILPIITKNNKVMIGWDEILQPGVPKTIIIQSWRGKEAFFQSVRSGYQAILSNGYYIDLIQPASFHYMTDPLPREIDLTPDEVKRVLGGEATMWSEHVTPETVDSRIWPRTAAIAERLWSPNEVEDTKDMYRRLEYISLYLDGLGLRHLSYKPPFLRRLCGSVDTKSLETLVNVIEPLKIYERNQGDTMYTVFSPYTKLADVATPDQDVPRKFNILVDSFLLTKSRNLALRIQEQLTIWKNNNTALLPVIKQSPVLNEAKLLSANLSKAASAGLEALAFIGQRAVAGQDWVKDKMVVMEKSKEQSGRCELQVVVPIRKLIAAAGGNKEPVIDTSAVSTHAFADAEKPAVPMITVTKLAAR